MSEDYIDQNDLQDMQRRMMLSRMLGGGQQGMQPGMMGGPMQVNANPNMGASFGGMASAGQNLANALLYRNWNNNRPVQAPGLPQVNPGQIPLPGLGRT